MGERARIFAMAGWMIAASLASAVATAQDMPQPDGDPVDATEFATPTEQRQEQIQVPGPDGQPRVLMQQRAIAVLPRGYRSHTLKGEFLAQWMYIIQRGRLITFWGARIVRLDPDSPLRTLGVRAGDVITRLDGIPIWQGMSRAGGGVWQLPELERHYGGTEVRYILRNSHSVRVGQVMLDGDGIPDDADILPIAP